ncbi:hypothetical protein DM02DRAFT_4925 [Periconia macrospinosa]|uniref:Uncharacterized protein n=1 Tax=Periconia macrospinosa TaxID=97972 RepID=A0A2V1EG81_9PLEO|nr:hypothetical protein DM02DRAFT_4925 [Periconia macrospinosa]
MDKERMLYSGLAMHTCTRTWAYDMWVCIDMSVVCVCKRWGGVGSRRIAYGCLEAANDSFLYRTHPYLVMASDTCTVHVLVAAMLDISPLGHVSCRIRRNSGIATPLAPPVSLSIYLSISCLSFTCFFYSSCGIIVLHLPYW